MSVKEIFDFQKLKILFIEIIFQNIPSNVSFILLLYLHNRGVICKKWQEVADELSVCVLSLASLVAINLVNGER